MNPNIILKNTATMQAWGQCLAMALDNSRYIPDWVTASKTKAEIKAGYIRGGKFYRPLYRITHPEGEELAYLIDHNSAAALLKAWNKLGMRKDKRITQTIAGYIPIKENGSY